MKMHCEFIYFYTVPRSVLSKTENVHFKAFTYVSRAICFWRAAGCASVL